MDADRRLLATLWVATALAIVGQLVDLRWHATNAHFETAADQVEAHWLVWLGEGLVLVVAVAGARRPSSLGRAYRTLAWIAAALAAVTLAHFVAHAAGADPNIIHVLLAVAKVAALAGVVLVTVGTVGRRRDARPT